MWTDRERFSYFSTHQKFEENYCREGINGTLARLPAGVNPNILRLLSWQFSYLMPYAAHATPNWNHGATAPTVILKFGARQQRAIPAQGSCGLCAINADVYFWISKQSQAWRNIENEVHQNWLPYDDGEGNRVYFSQNLNNGEIPCDLLGVIELLRDEQLYVLEEYVRAAPRERNRDFSSSWVPR